MKITNLRTGLAYQLTPGTQLEVERVNLFFNEWGEQTLPVELPDSDWNRRALGFPNISAVHKMPTDIPATIADGEYFAPCRQAILKMKSGESFSTSFYMNEGSFLSQATSASLAEVFGKESINGVNTVQEGIEFCRRLLNNADERFSIFPVLVDLDNTKRCVNRLEYLTSTGEVTLPGGSGTSFDFYNAYPRTEKVDEVTVKLDPGFYMSPFVRATYVLRRIFAHWGYTLQNNFFDVTDPFRDMVFVNNTIDSLVNGEILLAHLLPECSCHDVLNVFRKKFLCEFIPNESNQTVEVVLFRDLIRQPAETDLSDCLTSGLEMDVPEYQRVVLASESTVTEEKESYDSTFDLKQAYPNACYDPRTGDYCRVGYNDWGTDIQVIGSGNMPYADSGNSLKEKKVSVPDAQFAMESLHPEDAPRFIELNEQWRISKTQPYIGPGRTLNSTLIIDSKQVTEENEQKTTSTASNEKQLPILAFVKHLPQGFNVGTNHNYHPLVAEKLGDYSLLYNGPAGIYEQFYRDYDNILRNSAHPIRGEFLLDEHRKMNLPAHKKIMFKGQELLVDKLKYSIGGENTPMESTLLTTRLYEPAQTAIGEAGRFPTIDEGKCWEVVQRKVEISEQDFNADPLKVYAVGSGGSVRRILGDGLPSIYPPFPTAEQVRKGERLYERSFVFSESDLFYGSKKYYRVFFSLKAVKTPE